MQVVRGRPIDPEADPGVTARLLEYTRATGERTLRVWHPHRIVAFGRRDATRAGYDEARSLAVDAGYTPIERNVGGHAVAYTGSTLAFVRTEPVSESRTGIGDRYDAMAETLQGVFADLGVEAETGEPPGAFCPGSHSLQADGKIAGLAQRVRSEAAVVSGIVIVRDHEEIATVLDPIYDALGIDFDPDATGSLARAGGTSDPEIVRETLEDGLVSPDATTFNLEDWPGTVRDT